METGNLSRPEPGSAGPDWRPRTSPPHTRVTSTDNDPRTTLYLSRCPNMRGQAAEASGRRNSRGAADLGCFPLPPAPSPDEFIGTKAQRSTARRERHSPIEAAVRRVPTVGADRESGGCVSRCWAGVSPPPGRGPNTWSHQPLSPRPHFHRKMALVQHAIFPHANGLA